MGGSAHHHRSADQASDRLPRLARSYVRPAAVILAVALAFPAITALSAGQSVETLRSAAGADYQVRIEQPAQNAPATGYLLFVVLDGDLYFDLVAGLARDLAASGQIPPTVVVGVSAASPGSDTTDFRLRDFTDAVDERLLPERIRQAGSPTGGVKPFIAFVGDRLIPHVRREIRIDQRCSAIFGHSLGGLGVLHFLAARPEQFAIFAASSPSIWWGDRSVLARLANLPAKPTRRRPRLLLTVGSLEQPVEAAPASTQQIAPARPNFRMIDNAKDLARLAKSQPRSVTPTFELIDNRTHATVVRDAVNRALLLSGECRQTKAMPQWSGKTTDGQKGGR